MIAACPSCGSRYRIDVARLKPEGARLRCARCEAVFRVTPPADATKPPAPVAAPAPARQPVAAAVAQSPPFEHSSEIGADKSRIVLVADPEPEHGKATANALARWGLQPVLAHDGVEAILTIQRTLPRVVVLDAALPKMFGFQVCELMKRNASLREISVILVGAIHHHDRSRRPPNELYGADAYIERPELPDALHPILKDLGLPIVGSGAVAAGPPTPRAPLDEPPTIEHRIPRHDTAPKPVVSQPPQVAPAPAASAAAPVVPAPPPVAVSAPAPVVPEADRARVEQAERLARIVVSDIVLYNQEKFDAAVVAGNVVASMEAEIAEGRALFAQRVDDGIRERRDFLAEERVRVARSKGMK